MNYLKKGNCYIEIDYEDITEIMFEKYEIYFIDEDSNNQCNMYRCDSYDNMPEEFDEWFIKMKIEDFLKIN